MTSWVNEVEEMANLWRVIVRTTVDFKGGPVDDVVLVQPDLIPRRIMKFAAPNNIDASELMGHHLRNAEADSSLNIDDVVNFCTTHTDDWEGAGASSFREYLGQIESAVNAQTSVLEGAAEATEAYHALLRGTRNELSALIKSASAGLEAAQMSALEIGAGMISAVASIASGSLIGPVVVGFEMAVTSVQSAHDEIEVLYSFAEGLDELFKITEECHATIAKCFKLLGNHILDNALTMNPPRPLIAMNKAFETDWFSIDFPGFDKHKGKVSTEPLVAAPLPHMPDPLDIIIDAKRKEDENSR